MVKDADGLLWFPIFIDLDSMMDDFVNAKVVAEEGVDECSVNMGLRHKRITKFYLRGRR